MEKIIDAHIHLDHYDDREISMILHDLAKIQCTDLISVSYDLGSCKRNRKFALQDPRVRSAFGFHPEQEIPTDAEIAELLSWMDMHQDEMIAIGEVGLPYYFRREKSEFPLYSYIELLESFLKRANEWNKPVVLHAIYEDAAIVCDLLEKYHIADAHFHWFKGDTGIVERMIENGYMISITPDVLYEEEIQELVRYYPLERIMVETDGPWPFEGIFKGKMTHPSMIHRAVEKISTIKRMNLKEVYEQIYRNTMEFYRL
ncbi:TatD family hydrolase [Pseudogracilibacillus auburnensis]|uniref:TatD family hydrolase n=1 Tax=Pseudogracilibacillus auburnensis TaxID=1494959 RepID=UPI001A9761EF|nr:TatD family hydrolase [Pseudogracilibacillus auburnensis]MBO1005951.1 TatD family hydrolase [Pseudogracilibacillus auburnensis]